MENHAKLVINSLNEEIIAVHQALFIKRLSLYMVVLVENVTLLLDSIFKEGIKTIDYFEKKASE